MRFLCLVLIFLMSGSAIAESEADMKAERTSKVMAEHPKPPTPQQVQQMIGRGVAFLVKDQNKNGSWGSCTHTTGMDVYAPIPGSHHAFRLATTSLVVMALIDLNDKRPEVISTLERAEKFIMDEVERLRRAEPGALYNVWGHAYSISALAKMYDRLPDDEARREKIIELVNSQVERLKVYAKVQGGWSYYEFGDHYKQPAGIVMSFTTATALIALHDARRIGANVPQSLVDGGMRMLRLCRVPDGSFLYGDYHLYRPRHLINRPCGSLGRSQACHLAMRLWGDKIADEVLVIWLDKLFSRIGWLDMARKKPIPHESFAYNSGYFFYYGMYYASECIEQLPEGQRQAHRDKLNTVLWHLQEKDGSWWDYPLYDYHRPYGTAYALMCLAQNRK